MEDFVNGLKMTQTVLLPIGATEQHGSHLPLGTDTFQAVDVCRKLASQKNVFVAPAIPYGVCRSSVDHPGTITITTETLKALVIDVIRSLYRKGLRNFIVLTGHAGGTHQAALIDTGECLLMELSDARISVVTEYDLASETARHLVETINDSHAGEIETSRMLATRPEMVKGLPVAEYPDFPKNMLVRNKQNYWPGGIWGDPTKASAEKGQKIEECVVEALSELVDQLETFSEK